MAINAGELQIQITANTDQLKKLQEQLKKLQGKVEKAKSGFGKMAAAFGLVNIAMDVGKKVLSSAFNEMQRGIKLATDLTESQNKLNVTFSNIANNANMMRDNLVTAYGLSKNQATELLGATGDLLTGFGFAQDKALDLSNSVQQLAVDLASFQNLEGGAEQASIALTKALLGETESAKSLGIVIRQNTPEFRAQVEAIMESTGATESQAKAEVILQQAMTQSKNALGDYARTTDSLANRQRTLKNVQDDIVAGLGKQFLPIINAVTGRMLDGAKSLRAWASEDKNLKALQNTLAGIGTAIFAVIKVIQLNFKILFLPVRIFNALKTATEEVLSPFEELGKSISNVASKAKEYLLVAFNGVVEVMGNVINRIKGLLEFFDIKLPKALTNSANVIIDEFKNMTEEVITDFEDVKKFAEDSFAPAMANSGKNSGESFSDALTETFKTETEKNKDKWNDFGLQLGEGILSGVSEVLGSIGELFDSFYEEQLERLAEQHDMEIEAIEERLARELELIENDGMTKEEKRQQDLMMLQQKLKKETDSQKKADLLEQISSLEKEMAIEKAKKKSDLEKEKSDIKYANKKYKIEKEQFESKKAMDAIQASISYALGLISLWANVWSLGPIAGAVMGGVMTGVLTGIYAANLATILSQQPPPPPQYATGTLSAPGGRALVGEQGPELVNLPRGAQVEPAYNTRQSLSRMSKPVINAMFIMSDEEVPLNNVMINQRERQALRTS